MGNYKQLALDIQKRAGMNNQEIVENPLGCSTKRIKLPWFLVHREANEFPQKEQELCWLLALPYPESYKAKIAFPSIQQILSKSVPLCGKILLRQDRSENLQCPVAFKCFCIKRKAFLPVNWDIFYPLQCREVSSMTLAGFQAIYCSVDFICLRAASELTCYFHTGWRSETAV